MAFVTPMIGDVIPMPQSRTAQLIDWVLAPDWLTVEEAALLSGYSRDLLLWLIEDGGVDTNEADLVEKRSLWEYQEALNLVSSWKADPPLDTM